MDQVHRGGPWTRSTGVVHGPGSMFCIRPNFRYFFIAKKQQLVLYFYITYREICPVPSSPPWGGMGTAGID